MDALRARKLLTVAATLVAIVIGLSLPALYFFQGLTSARTASAAIVQTQAVLLTRVISRSPQTWRFHENLLNETLALSAGEGAASPAGQAIRLLDARGEIIVSTSDVPGEPRLAQRAALNDSGQLAGYVEHIFSLREVLQQTLWVALAGALLALLVYGVLRSLPLRAVNSAIAELQSEVARAEAALAEKAATETALRENEVKIMRQARCERLLESLAAASNTAQTPDEAMSSFLRQICEFAGWPLGRASLVNIEDSHAVTQADFWHRPRGQAYDDLVEVSSRGRYSIASGIFVGKVLRTCAPVWINDLSEMPDYARAQVFASLGLRAGMAFPIVRGHKPIGFFEFHATTALPPDAELIALIERASAYVGGVADRVESAEQIRRLNIDLERRVAERTRQNEAANAMIAARGRDAELLGEMTGVLQIAENLDEAGMLVSRYVPSALQGTENGALYLMRASRDHLERLSAWGNTSSVHSFPPGQCWGMRRGQPHGSLDGAVPLTCAHICEDETPGGMLCLPLVAQGESLGMLQIGYGEAGDADVRRERIAAAKRVAEQLSLALANVRLRDSLREQSIRDTLTGLHNRRYLEESLHRELARSGREKQPLALFMLDVDHFKRYNDTHGHEAGDAALRELGRELRDCARDSDIVCRYGGEEFTAVLPNTGQEEASAWSERLMRKVRAMDVRLGSGTLPSVTVSMGLAIYPQHGGGVDALLKAADAALYVAKHEGRDRLRVVETAAIPSQTEATQARTEHRNAA